MSRGQSRLRVGIWIAIALIATLTVLSLTISPPEERQQTWIESVFFSVLSPFQRASVAVRDQTVAIVQGYIYLIHTADRNRELVSENDRLRGEMLLYQKLSEENNRLRQAIGFAASKRWNTVMAKVIAQNTQGEYRLLTINRGEAAGIQQRMPVVSPAGLVGQVYRTSKRSSQILLISDPTSAVDARLAETGARGLLRGRVVTMEWDRTFYLSALEYVDQAMPLVEGGHVLTSGLDGVFPEGIPVGRIRQIERDPAGVFQSAEVIPHVDLLSLREVLVITNKETE